MALLEMREECFFQSLNNNTQFVICGCGGTGGYVVRDLARMVSLYNAKYQMNMSILLLDRDEVSERNLTRQNFISEDISHHKAEVLAKRYGSSFNVSIDYILEYVTNRQGLQEMVSSGGHRDSILIGCIDNNKSRHILHDFYRSSNNVIAYIDAGNEKTGGQVVFSCKNAIAKNLLNNGYHTPVNFKDVVELYDLPNNDKLPTELSCAEHAVSAPQDILANMTAANLINNYCSIILDNGTFYKKRSLSGLTEFNKLILKINSCKPLLANANYFDTNSGSVSSKFFTKAEINPRSLTPINMPQKVTIDKLIKTFEETEARLAMPNRQELILTAH